MTAHDPFDRLERLVHRPVSSRPDWLLIWRDEAHHLLFLARRAAADDDADALDELAVEADGMADAMERRLAMEQL
jgi:hypothetical protein